MYKVYWIKSSEHSDPLKEGYIGITSQSLDKRFNDHKHNTKNNHLRNRCRKQDTEIICLLENLNSFEAKKIELTMRPSENIGWNINKGGDLPPSRKGKVSLNSKLKGNERTEKQKLAAEKHSERMKGNNSSGKRKNKIVHNKYCENCNINFIAKEKRTKYCSLKCAAIKREKNKCA
jgi:hypothetical protein